MNLPSTVYIRWGDKVISRPVDQWGLTPTDQYPHGIWMARIGKRFYAWGIEAFATEEEAEGPERAVEEQEAYEWWRSQQ